ncbi:MAG: ribonuclease P protein subunit [Thermoplasmata archaeon]|nr:MAG: ribonuclease P protein subunit [Thermoplasmata archaeon]
MRRMRTKRPDPVNNVHILELIGTSVEVLDHSDPGLRGLAGRIVDETMGMIVVDGGKRRLKIPKRSALLRIRVIKGGSEVPVDIKGDDILYRPEDRTKKCERKRPKTPKSRNEGKVEVNIP